MELPALIFIPSARVPAFVAIQTPKKAWVTAITLRDSLPAEYQKHQEIKDILNWTRAVCAKKRGDGTLAKKNLMIIKWQDVHI